MTQRDAFILGVTQFCKQAGLDADDTVAMTSLLLGDRNRGMAIIKRAQSDPKIAAMIKEAWSWGGLLSNVLSYGADTAGYGMIAGSLIPGLGTGVGTAIGGVLGGLYGLYKGLTEPDKPTGGSNAAAGSKALPNNETQEQAVQSPYLAGLTGLSNEGLQQAAGGFRQRHYASNFLRRTLRAGGLSGVDVERLTPQQMQAAGLSAEQQALVRAAQKYRQQQRILAGGRGFSQWGSGFRGAPRPVTPTMQSSPTMPTGGRNAPAGSVAPAPANPTGGRNATAGATLLSGGNSFIQRNAVA